MIVLAVTHSLQMQVPTAVSQRGSDLITVFF